MSDPHTLLLVPPPGDTTLLADEAGGRVPMWWATPNHLHASRWTQPDEGDANDFVESEVCVECGNAWPCAQAGQVAEPSRWVPPEPGVYPPIPAGAPRALVLVHKGAPVPMGIDRVRRHVGEAPDMEYAVADAVAVAHEYVETHPDTRIVALGADGREVTP
jgi:hypothetical protein